MNADEKSQVFEMDLILRSPHGEAVESREYSTNLPMTPADAAKQLMDSLPNIEKSRLKKVADGG